MPFDAQSIDQAALSERRTLDPRIRLLAIGSFAIGTDMMVISGILPLIASDLAVSHATAGQLVSAYAFAYAIGAPIFAALTARLPGNRVILAALALFTLASIGAALAPNFETLIAARIVAGLAAAIYSPTAYAIASTMAAPAQRGAALAAVILGLSSSALIGVPLGVAVGSALGWHGTYWTITIMALIGMTALIVNPLPRIQNTTLLGFWQRFAPLADRRVLLTLLPSVFWNIAIFTVFTYLGALLVGHGYNTNEIASLMIAFGLGSVTGSQLGGWTTDRWGARRPILMFLALGTLGLIALPWAVAATSTLAIALFVMGIVGWGTFTPQQSRLIALDPASAGVNLALANSTLYGSQALGAILGAVAIPVIGLDNLAFVSVAIMQLAIATMLIGVRRRATCT
jgi:predicted MFS family arabinose efflux permease